MYRVIIWGIGREYNKYYNLIKYFEQMGEITVQAVFSNDKINSATLDGFAICSKEQVKIMEYDLCLVAVADFCSVKLEAKELGISEAKLLPIRVLGIPYFSFEKYIKVRNSKITILSNNCWAGLCYHYLDLEFESPTINMFFEGSQFIKFVSNLDYYLSVPLEFIEMRYEKNLNRNYPIAKIDDIRLHFNHYISFEEAQKCWERRKQRINKNNILIVFNSTSKEALVEFQKLKFEHKLVFVPKDMGISNLDVYPVDYNDIGTGITFGMYVNGFANGGISDFDLLSFLCHEKYMRKNR